MHPLFTIIRLHDILWFPCCQLLRAMIPFRRVTRFCSQLSRSLSRSRFISSRRHTTYIVFFSDIGSSSVLVELQYLLLSHQLDLLVMLLIANCGETRQGIRSDDDD